MYRVLGQLPEQLRRWPAWQRHVVALAAAVLAIALRYVLLGPTTGYAYLTAFPAVVITAALLGAGPGFTATLAAGIASVFFFVAPNRSAFFTDTADALAFVMYLVSCAGILLVTQILHSALLALGTANDRLARQSYDSELLLREAAHRRQNDLARLIATLKLQAGASGNGAVRDALEEASGRIMALARVDRVLMLTSKGDSFVDAREFLTGVLDDVVHGGSIQLRPISLDVALESRRLPKEQVVPLGLIATELISNTLKYAFPDGRAGRIRFTFRQDGADYVMGLEDNGVGFRPADPPRGTGLGRMLVQALVGQLNGRLEITGQCAAGGAAVQVRFPINASDQAGKGTPAVASAA